MLSAEGKSASCTLDMVGFRFGTRCIALLLLHKHHDSRRHCTGRYEYGENARLTWDRLLGFLLGATMSGAGMYYYVIDEYRVSNQLLTEDIYVRCIFIKCLRRKLTWETGAPVRGSTDRRLCSDARGKGRREKEVKAESMSQRGSIYRVLRRQGRTRHVEYYSGNQDEHV